MHSINHIPLARTRTLTPFLDFLREMGTPVEKLLHTAKVPGHKLQEPDALIPLHAGATFLELAARNERLVTLGSEVGARTPLERLGPLGELMLGSPTLFHALESARKLVAAVNSGLRIWVERNGGHARIFHQSFNPPGLGKQQVDQFGVMLLLTLVRLAAGPHWQPGEVGLQMRYRREIADCNAFAADRLVFDQPASFVTLSADLLACPLRYATPTSRRSRGELTETLEQSAPSLDLTGSLRQVIDAQMSGGRTGLHCVAESVGMSSRSLQRRLFEKGIGYSRLLEQARFERSRQLLTDPSVKSQDVAKELGYRDCANFIRAFKRWTGVAPGEYRKQFSGCPAQSHQSGP